MRGSPRGSWDAPRGLCPAHQHTRASPAPQYQRRAPGVGNEYERPPARGTSTSGLRRGERERQRRARTTVCVWRRLPQGVAISPGAPTATRAAPRAARRAAPRGKPRQTRRAASTAPRPYGTFFGIRGPLTRVPGPHISTPRKRPPRSAPPNNPRSAPPNPNRRGKEPGEKRWTPYEKIFENRGPLSGVPGPLGAPKEQPLTLSVRKHLSGPRLPLRGNIRTSGWVGINAEALRPLWQTGTSQVSPGAPCQ
jgi:hypothetical protein